MYAAKILADSISEQGQRLTTMEVTFPRIVLAEFNTHRAFSRNSASSRAIPASTMIQRVKDNPFVPTYWGANQKGMQAHQEVGEREREGAEVVWRGAIDDAIDRAEDLMQLGVHKQLVNRLLEPFQWHTVIVSSTDWGNFLEQRNHPDAQPEIRAVAEKMCVALMTSVPTLLHRHEWHTPLMPVDEEDKVTLSSYDPTDLLKISVARCARVSYLTHDGKRDPEEDLRLYRDLSTHQPPHFSPFEHVATPRVGRHGNFVGWKQMRQFLEQGVDIS